MKTKFQHLFPTSFELIGLGFITVLVAILGNSKQLLNYYGLSSGNDVIRQSAGGAIVKGLSQLDNLSFTNQAVTFLIWAAVGLLCFSLAQAIAGGYRNFQREQSLSSNRFVHPSDFKRGNFWRHVLLMYILLIIGLLILAGLLYAFFGYVLPIGLTYTQLFLQELSLVHAGYFVLGLGVIFVGLISLNMCCRFLLQRRRLIG